jgi:hypothetical protein
MLMAPPYTCAKTSSHSASHTYRQYDAAGADHKALTLEPNEPPGASARRRRVRSGKLKQAGTVKNVRRLTMEELANLELLINTTRPLTSDCEEEEIDKNGPELHAYAPM